MSEEQDNAGLASIVLEEAPSGAEISISRDPLFGGDSFAFVTAKNVGLESLFRLLTKSLKFNDFMREILLTLMKVVKSEAGSILEVDHKNKQMIFRAVVGQSSDSITQFTVPLGQGIAGYVAESLQPLIVSELKDNRMHLKAIEKAVGFETRNLIALPIVIRGKIYGVVELLNRVGDDTYSPGDVELLTYLCDAAAKAIEVRLMLAYAQQAQTIQKKGEAA